MNKLTALYMHLLQSLDCKIEEDGLIYIRPSKKSEYIPAMINIKGKEAQQLAIPFNHVIRSKNFSDFVMFHPAAEVAFNGQSEVLNWLMAVMNLKLFNAVQNTTIALLSLAADKSKHEKLRVSVRKLLSDLPEVTPSTIKHLNTLINKCTGVTGEFPLLSLRLSRGKEINGVKFNKSCKLITPILDYKDYIYDVKTSGKSNIAIRAAYEIVIPKERELGTNSNDAGYLEALVGMYCLVAKHLNDLREVLGKHVLELDMIDISWLEEFASLQKYKKQFLNQAFPGNTGYPLQNEKREVKAPVINVPTPRVPVAVAPVHKPVPVSNHIPVAAPQVTTYAPTPAPVINRGQVAAMHNVPQVPVIPANIQDMSLADRMRLQRGIVPNVPHPGYMAPPPMPVHSYAPVNSYSQPYPNNGYAPAPAPVAPVMNRGAMVSGNYNPVYGR